MDSYNNMIYKFPFHLFAPKTRVLIYGCNNIGRTFYYQAKIGIYLDSIGIVDEDINGIELDVPLYDINDINSLEYDYLLLTAECKEEAIKSKKMLISKGIREDVIVWDEIISTWNDFLEKKYFSILKCLYADASNRLKLYSNVTSRLELLNETIKSDTTLCKKAYETKCVSIAFMNYASGLGDAIIVKKVFEVVSEIDKTCRIDIYAKDERNEVYAKVFYGDERNLNSIYAKGLYEDEYKNYDIAMRVWHRIEIDYVNKNKLNEKLAKAIEKILIFNEMHKENLDYNKCILHNIKWAHSAGVNRYTCLACNGALPIYDSNVRIPLLESKRKEFEQLSLKNYLTINVGSGDDYQKQQLKEWPIDYFEKLVELLKKEYAEIEVVQIGAKGQKSVAGIDRGLFGENLELIKYILKNSILHIDCEGGLVHLATQLGTKCAVVFGPTDVDYYGYKNNINIVSSVCSPCIGKWKNRYTCMLGDEVPPRCMKSITPQMVFEQCKKAIKIV